MVQNITEIMQCDEQNQGLPLGILQNILGKSHLYSQNKQRFAIPFIIRNFPMPINKIIFRSAYLAIQFQ